MSKKDIIKFKYISHELRAKIQTALINLRGYRISQLHQFEDYILKRVDDVYELYQQSVHSIGFMESEVNSQVFVKKDR